MNTSRRGDSFSYIGPVRRSVDGVLSPYDLTGWSASATLERNGTAGTLPLTAEITDATNGIVHISQLAATTAAWPPGFYDFKLRLVTPAGIAVSGGSGQFKVVA